jgi:hypothetical protein
MANAIDAIRGLTSDQIHARLCELTAEEKVLRTLLRSVKAGERVERCRKMQEARSAS